MNRHKELFAEAHARIGDTIDADGIGVMIGVLLEEKPDATIDDLMEIVRDHQLALAAERGEPLYKIQARDKAGNWALDLVGEPNEFDSIEEAERAIDNLQSLHGGDYADTEMRVVRATDLTPVL